MIFSVKLKTITAVFVSVTLIMIMSLSIVFPEDSIQTASSQNYIKWVDYNVTQTAMNDTLNIDIASVDKEIHIDWIELLAVLGCKYGGNFKSYKKDDLTQIVDKIENGEKAEDIGNKYGNYNYYFKAYSAVLDNFCGTYMVKTEEGYEERYGIKAFSPIAKGYCLNHYKDFGSSRSYGFKRQHLGNDLMGSIGTPIVAIESGYVESLGWNMYGGWRIGIRSFDKKRYYYYAHLRKDHPYAQGLEEGQAVKAGDVIGYLGMTGYSTKENTNNINIPHLHFGMQLIFDESQKEANSEIWIDVYEIINFLEKNKSAVKKINNEYIALNEIILPEYNEYIELNKNK